MSISSGAATVAIKVAKQPQDEFKLVVALLATFKEPHSYFVLEAAAENMTLAGTP